MSKVSPEVDSHISKLRFVGRSRAGDVRIFLVEKPAPMLPYPPTIAPRRSTTMKRKASTKVLVGRTIVVGQMVGIRELGALLTTLRREVPGWVAVLVVRSRAILSHVG